jgi:arylsulfatase A-like enzyme
LIVSDDQGWADHGFMGHPVVKTPNVDRLAAESMVYTRGYNVTSVCRPSLASYAIGRFPHQSGVTSNDPPGDRSAARDPAARAAMEEVFASHRTVPALLGDIGYLSLQTGKWWEGDPRDHGFTIAMTHGDVSRGGRHGDEGLTIGREGLQPIDEFLDLAGEEGAPFFLWYAPFMPHTPHTPPERLLAKYEADDRPVAIARYYAMIEWFDETVGDLLNALDQRGLRDNTLVLYIVDNGWLQAADPREQGKTPGKMSPYDAGIRTPVMVRWPGRVDPGRDEQTLVSGVDVAPTILRAAGLEPMRSMQGLDLTDRAALARREVVFASLSAHTSVDIRNPVANLKYRMAIDRDGWKLILPYAPNQDVPLTIDGVVGEWARLEPELYNLHDDPTETTDLASARPEIVSRLRGLIDDWWLVPE